MKSIYTIILNYNNLSDTCECIDSLNQLDYSCDYDYKIVLVDNFSNDGSYEKLQELYSDRITIIRTENNLGYAGGNNVGIRYSIKENADYICILNNDTVVTENFYLECVGLLNESDDIAFVSPVIEEYDIDVVQSTGGDIIIQKGLVTLKNNNVKRESLSGIIQCDYVGGACMLFKASLINIIGEIPENYFLFFEETEWCYKAKKCGLNNYCVTSTMVKHKGSASIDSIGGLHSYLMERNRIVFIKRNASSNMLIARAVIYLVLKYIKWGICKDKKYFRYLEYIKDGLFNIVDYKKYPFIVIRESE